MNHRAKTLLFGLGFFLLLGAAAGTAFADETYELTVSEPKAAVGTKGIATVTIAAKKGWKVNAEAPVTLKLTPAPGVTVEKPRLTRKDLAENTLDRARFDVAFTATEPGKKTIAADCSFVMCQETTCKPIKESVVLAMDVAAAGAAAAAPAKKKAK